MEARRVKTSEAGLQRSRQPGLGGRRQRAAPGPGSTGTSTLPAQGRSPEHPNKKGRLCRSEAKASRQSRDRLKRHPQEGQHSAASWRDPGPSASGERLNRAITCCAMGLEPTDRDVSRLGSQKPGAAEPHAPLLIILGGVSLLSGLHICKSVRARRRELTNSFQRVALRPRGETMCRRSDMISTQRARGCVR